MIKEKRRTLNKNAKGSFWNLHTNFWDNACVFLGCVICWEWWRKLLPHESLVWGLP